ncbi:MAG TPA: hypothetical protein VMF88_14365 [Bacteroidota bacterium]|nr:hypothetical protein [Bacteroidota bacterium]
MNPTAHPDTIQFRYTFEFENREVKVFEITLNGESLELVHEKDLPKPEWTKLSFYPCEHCPLAPESEHCPVAVNLSQIVTEFKDSVSHERTRVTVETPERTYMKDTTLQKGLSSIIGIYMVTSNCPVMDKLRPMVRFHLPFATPTETLFRTVSTYLTGQFLLMRDGKKPDWEMEKLVDLYKAISAVNKGMSRRISNASVKDANVNAVIILHSFGDAVPYFIENGLDEIRHFFDIYTKDDR